MNVSTVAKPATSSAARPWLGLIANRRVRTKFLISVLIIGAFAVGIAFLGLSKVASMKDDVSAIHDTNVQNLTYVAEIRRGMMLVYDGDTGLANWAGKEVPADQQHVITTAKQQLIDGDAVVDGAIDSYLAVSKNSPERTQPLNAIADALYQWRAMRDFLFLGVPMPSDVTMSNDVYALNASVSANINALASIEENEANAAATQSENSAGDATQQIVVTTLLGLLVAIALSLAIANMITKPLAKVTRAVQAMGQGDLTQDVAVEWNDEVGEMADAVTRTNSNIRTTIQALADSAETLGTNSRNLSAISDQIANSAATTSEQASNAATIADQVSRNTQTAAAGGEEMGMSIREIARSASEGTHVAAKAVTMAKTTNETITKLGTSSAEIGSVIKLINSIAEQTNLLALNATIEAARAGDAGKGFAVVAGEVKDLAQATASATKDISHRVEAIQSDTLNAVSAIGEITNIISQLNDYQLTIASAVEEQTATTSEISRSVADAATGSGSIANRIAGLADTAQVTAQGAVDNQSAAVSLDKLSANLRSLVTQFRY